MGKAAKDERRESKAEALTENADGAITRGSGNVFADLGFENPEEELAKAKLVVALSEVIERTDLTQAKVARMLGVDQPTISKILRGRTGGFTADRLLRFLNLLDQDVTISVSPKREVQARVTVSVAPIAT